ncbi:hypothetical protein C1N81_37115 [Streptomyces sp. SGAir0957]
MDADIARLRARLETLSNKTIGVDVTTGAAIAEMDAVDEELRRLGASHPNIQIRADTATARAAIAQMREEIAVLTADPTRLRVEVEGALGAKLRASVKAAEASLPAINLTADSTPADVAIARVRAELAALGEKRIGIDVSSTEALAKVAALRTQLQELSASDADIAVRVDAGAAESQLAAVHAMVNSLDRDDVRINVRVNAAQATAALLQLAIAVGGVAAIPALPVIAAGLGAVASAGVAAGAGLGAMALVAVPAIKSVTNVMQLQKAATDEASRATSNGAAESVKAAQQALQMTSAQQALASARRQAAQSTAQANRQVEDAERSLGQAAARAMEQRRQAAENVERAERSLSDAKKAARQAEDDLTQARKSAADQLRDLDERLAQGSLDQRDATLRVQEAQLELQRVMADPKASDLQKERAQLSLDQATQAATQQKKDLADLQKSADEQRKAGVEGNADVKRAADQVASAQRNVQDQTKAVADANREAARAQTESAQAVADAQRAVADAVTNASNAQVQAAEQVASAERGIESARLSSVNTTAQAVTKSDEYQRALAKLTPAQRDLYDSIAGPKGLKSAFDVWQRSLQPRVLPIFTRAVDGLKNALPGLSPLVTNTADAVGDLQDRASKELRTPFWKDFRHDINDGAKPAVTGLGVAFGNTLKGMAGVIDAFLPRMGDISTTMQRITGRFADWGTGLKGSPEFEKFLEYASRTGPKLASALGKVAGAFFDIGKALAPLSGPVLDVIGAIAEGISVVATNAPWLIEMIWGIIVVTRIWTAAMWLLNIAMDANPIGLVIAAIVALIAIVVIAWNKFPWFRDVVKETWAQIQVVTSWLWETVLKPFFEWWSGNVVWFYDNILKPYFGYMQEAYGALGTVVTWLWTTILKPYFGALIDIWKKIAETLGWLWQNVWAPIFGFLGDIIAYWWRNVGKRYFGFLIDILKDVGGIFKWLYDKAVKPVMDAMAILIPRVYDQHIKPAFDKLKRGLELVSLAFKTAKEATEKHWKRIANITATPINFVIQDVYGKGLKVVWDKVAGAVGMDPLPAPPKPIKFLEAGGTVGDGWGVAAPMKTNRPTAIVGEGNPRYPEYVIPTDPKYRSRALALHQAAGTQLLEGGGILGKLKDTFGKAFSWGQAGADMVANPGSTWDKLMTPVVNSIAPGVAGSGDWGKMVGKAPRKWISSARDTLISAAKSMFVGDFSYGGLWTKPINAPFGTPFGKAGKMWSSGHHTGLDFPAAVGTAVRAVMDGQVLNTSSSGPYGNHILVQHSAGLQSLYAHLSSIMTKVGDKVKQGEVIGRSGATGNVSGPHLHLEARLGGRAVDPMKFLTGGGGGNATAVGSAQKYAKSILKNYGWGQGEFGPLKKLWEGESNWNYQARNPSSGAFGIPQALPAAKMASAGADWRTNPATQIRWGLSYIKNRPDYGSPSAAYSKWLSRSPHWYDDGGYLPPGLSLVANGTGSPEPVFTGSQWSDIRAAKSGGGTTQVHADVRVFVGDREITDIVDTRIEVHEAATITAINAGRY